MGKVQKRKQVAREWKRYYPLIEFGCVWDDASWG